MGAEIVTTAETAFGKGHGVVVHLTAAQLCGLLVLAPCGEGGHGVTVDKPLAGDCHVVKTVAIYHRGVVVEIGTLPRSVDNRIEFRVGVKHDDGTFGKIDAEIACEGKRPAEKVGSGRHIYASSACFLDFCDCLAESRKTVLHAISLRAEFQNVELTVRYRSSMNVGEDAVAQGIAAGIDGSVGF